MEELNTPLEVWGVHFLEPEGFCCVLLRVEFTNTFVVAWVDRADADVVNAFLNGHLWSRPHTHHVLEAALEDLGGLADIRLIGESEGVFLGELATNSGFVVDCRLSDAVVQSLLSGIPILAGESTLQAAVHISNAALEEYFDVEGPVDTTDGQGAESSPGQQANNDFAEMMKKMGVTESDLLGENDTDVT